MLSEKPWQLEQVLFLLMRLFASMFLGMVLVSGLASTQWLGTGPMEVVSLLIGTGSFHGVALILTHLFVQEHGLTWERAFGFLSPRLTWTLFLAAVVALAALPIAWSLQQLSLKILEWLHLPSAVQSPVQMLQTAESLPVKLLIGLLAIAVAPFVEEIVFRGLIYPTLKQHGFPKLALWGTSVLFAVIHNNLTILLPLTFLAVVLTLLYEATDNLLAPVLAHSLFNFANFLFVLIQSGGPVRV